MRERRFRAGLAVGRSPLAAAALLDAESPGSGQVLESPVEGAAIRLVTELAALYHERWEIENALDELKTHLRGPRIVLRSKTPELVRQEFYGLLLAHYAVRSLMHEAALKGQADPDELSFVHAVRVVKRKLLSVLSAPPQDRLKVHEAVLTEILEVRVGSSRGRDNPRAIKRKISKFPTRSRAQRLRPRRVQIQVQVVK